MLPGLVNDWVEAVVALRAAPGGDDDAVRAQGRLGLAVFRGLLLDLVGTRDRAGVDAAFEAFRALAAPPDQQTGRPFGHSLDTKEQ